MPVCVLGGATLLGTELCRQLGDDALATAPVDDTLLDAEAHFRAILQIQPSAVINTLEFADIERAEAEPEKCFAINAVAVKRIAEACELLRCPLIHISSAHLFGGEPLLRRPYRETDSTSPVGVYAHSKRAGEVYATLCHRHYIVRTGPLFGPACCQHPDESIVKSIMQLGLTQATVELPSDRYFTPSYTPYVARAIMFLLRQKAPYGTYHVVNSNFTTPYDFAFEVLRLAGIDTPVQPFMLVRSNGAEKWPRFAALDTSKYHRAGGPRMPTWQVALAESFSAREESCSVEHATAYRVH